MKRSSSRGRWRAVELGAALTVLALGVSAVLAAAPPQHPEPTGGKQAAAGRPARPGPAAERGAAQSPDLSWWSVDAGGGTVTGGSFTLAGAVGEPERGVSSSFGLGFAGGVWATAPTSLADSEIFSDGFESGTTTAWSGWTGR